MVFAEMDRMVTLAGQLQDDGAPVILVNTLVEALEDADARRGGDGAPARLHLDSDAPRHRG